MFGFSRIHVGFPVEFGALGADIQFVPMTPGQQYQVAGMSVCAFKQNHEGDSYGYRFEQNGQSVVYSTDGEHKIEDSEGIEGYLGFIQGADLLIFDAMYSLADAVSLKEDWGHSSNVVGVELCQRAGVKHYCMYHHEPIYDDVTLQQILAETIRYGEISQEGDAAHTLTISSAYDGMEIEV